MKPALIQTLTLLLALSAAASASAFPGLVEKITLRNGVTVLVQPDPDVNTVAICCFIRAGAAEEEGITGLGALAARSLFGSNDNQSREAVNRDIYLAGGSLETAWTHDYTLITCVTDRATFKDAFYAIGQALKTALFEPETVESARRVLISEAQAGDSDPVRAAAALARTRLYSTGPYRAPDAGTPETLTRIRAATLLAYHRKRFTPGATVISVAGNITAEEVERSAENQLIDYDRTAAKPAFVQQAQGPSAPIRLSRKLPIRTQVVVAAYRGPGVADPDYPAWMVLNAIVGGGKSSRLFRSVRDVSGVGYSVMSQAANFAKDGNLMALVEYDPARPGPDGKPLASDVVSKMMLEAIGSVTASPPDEAEVARARRFVAGKLALAHERVRDRAFHTGWYEIIGVGHAFDAELPRKIAAVTAEDVLRLAKKWLRNEVVVGVGPGL